MLSDYTIDGSSYILSTEITEEEVRELMEEGETYVMTPTDHDFLWLQLTD